jgi:hypothetical protein
LAAAQQLAVMSSVMLLFAAALFGMAHAIDWPNSSHTVIPLQKVWNGKHWTVDVQVKTSASGIVTVPLIIDSSIGHMIIMSQLLCDVRVCDGCGYVPPATGSCLPVNPAPSASAETSLFVDLTTVSLFVAAASAPIAFLNKSFPPSPSNFQLAVPDSGDQTKILRGAAFWNGTAGRLSFFTSARSARSIVAAPPAPPLSNLFYTPIFCHLHLHAA